MTFNVSGDSGRDGSDGRSYRGSASGYGSDGRDGGDGQRGQGGEDAGSVRLNLRMLNGRSEGVVRVSGSIMEPGESSRSQISEQTFNLRTHPQGYIYVNLRGGDGGDGGDAGSGEDGARGRSGSDATRYSWGTDGGPGGDGGDAGNPADGGRAGAGGDFTLGLPASQTALAILVRSDRSPGWRGDGGDRAQGGSGGSGGPGGSSYSWTESHTETYTKSDGSTGTRTRTTYHSNPGGSRGRSGSSGLSSSYTAVDGAAGEWGQLTIEVSTRGGATETYSSPFNLELEKYDIVSENEDEIFEPGETISFENFVIRNTGDMPTPENFTVRLYLVNRGMVVAEPKELEIRQSIPGGEALPLEGDENRLFARIKNTTIVEAGEPFSRTDRISPLAQLRLTDEVSRPFRDFPYEAPVDISFPIKMTPIETLYSMAPGEVRRIIFSIKNTSNRSYGKAELEREIRTRLNIAEGSEIGAGQIVYFDQDDRPIRLGTEGFLKEVMSLGPGDSTLIEGSIGLLPRSDIEPYESAQIRSSIDLERPQSDPNPDRIRPVQHREFTIRAAQAYEGHRDAGFLLVVNAGTTRAEIEAWTEKLRRISGSEPAILDISYYGKFDLAAKMSLGDPLLKEWKGKNVVVLNNEFESPSGVTAAAELLANRQFIAATADYDMGVLQYGGESNMGEALIPTDEISFDDQMQFNDVGEFMKAIRDYRRWIRTDGERGENVFPDAISRYHASIDVNSFTFWGVPKKRYIEARAARLQLLLDRYLPDQRYHVIIRFDPTETNRGWFTKRWNWGKIEIRRSLDTATGNAAAMVMSDEQVHDTSLINSRETDLAIFTSMFDGSLVKLFEYLVTNERLPGDDANFSDFVDLKEIGETVIEAMMQELSVEQGALRSTFWRRGFSRDDVRARLPMMNALLRMNISPQADSPGGDLFTTLVANIMNMHRSGQNFWEKFIPFNRSKLVAQTGLRMARELLDNTFGKRKSLIGSETRQTRNRHKADDIIVEKEKQLIEIGKRNYEGPESRGDLVLDVEFRDPNSRLHDGDDYDRAVGRNEYRDAQIREYERANEAANKDFDCERLREELERLSTRTF